MGTAAPLRSGYVRHCHPHLHWPALLFSSHVRQAADAGRYHVIAAPGTQILLFTLPLIERRKRIEFRIFLFHLPRSRTFRPAPASSGSATQLNSGQSTWMPGSLNLDARQSLPGLPVSTWTLLIFRPRNRSKINFELL